MLASALLTLVLTRQQGPATVATFTMAGKPVAITLPTAVPEGDKSLPFIDFGGYTYQFDASGNLVGRSEGRDFWQGIRESYEDASKKWTKDTPLWRIKAFIVPSTDTLDHGPDGFLRQKRVVLTDDYVDRVKQALGRFAVAADAAGHGAVRIQLDVELDWDSWLTDAEAGKGVFSELNDYVKPRINGAGFVDDDRVYRGPYDSIFVLHSALIGDSLTPRSVMGQRVSPISIVPRVEPLSGTNLEAELLRAWGRDLAEGAQRLRLPVRFPGRSGDIRDSFTNDESILALTGGPQLLRDDPAMDDLRRAAASTETGSGLQGESFKSLAVLDPEQFGAKLGNDQTKLQVAAFGRVAFLYRAGSDAYVFSELPYADFVLKNLDPSVKSEQLGLLSKVEDKEFGSSDYLVIKVTAPSADALADVLVTKPSNLGKGNPPPSSFGVTSATKFDGSPNVSVVLGTDPNHGAMVSYTETGRFRQARAQTWFAETSLASRPILSFWVKTKSREPIAVTVDGDSGWSGVVVGRRDELPSQWGPQGGEPLFSTSIEPNDTWQQVEVDLSKVAKRPIDWLAIGTPIGSQSIDRRSSDPIQYDFADFKLIDKPEGMPASSEVPTGKIDSADELDRARYALRASQDELLVLLKDVSDQVRLNAAARFQTIKHAAAEPLLGELARTGNPRVVKVAIDALLFQGTPTAKAEIRKALDNGPFDWNRALAARALAADKSPELAGSFSALFAAKGWRERVEGARALGMLKGEESMAILMSFLLNADPAVRLAATQSADINAEIVQRRVQYTAVNDPIDAVRAASYILLLDAPTPQLRDEGRKGVKDDGVRVRIEVLEAIASHSRAEDRPAVLGALSDKVPTVRAVALFALSKLPGDVTEQDLSPVLKEEYPVVQLELMAFANAKKLTLPADTVELLKKSIDPQVRKKATALGE